MPSYFNLTELTLVFLLGALIILTSIIIGGLLFWVLLRRTRSSRPSVEARKESYEIIHKATQEADKIIGDAELEANKIVSDIKFRTGKVEEMFSQQLQEITEESKRNLAQKIEESQKEFSEYLSSLEKESRDLQEVFDQEISKVLEDFKKSSNKTLKELGEKGASAFQKELAEVRDSLEAYREKRMEIIDRNIVDILEKVLAEVLSERLSLKKHMEIVYKSLERAKREKFI